MSTQFPIDDAAAPDLVELENGRMIRIDGLQRSDRRRYLIAAESLSRRTLHLRFLSPISKISDAQVERFLDVGHDGREALVAVSCDTAEIVGVARFAPEHSEGDVVDVAVVVVDVWQFQGIGSCLLDRLIDLARRRGHRVAGGVPGGEHCGHSDAPGPRLQGGGHQSGGRGVVSRVDRW